MNPHRVNELRALAMDQWIADRLEQEPGLLDHARMTLKRWKAQHDGSAFYLQEWSDILKRPLPEIVVFLRRDDEEANRLRQSSPFCGMLPREVRTQILMSKPEGYHESEAA